MSREPGPQDRARNVLVAGRRRRHVPTPLQHDHHLPLVWLTGAEISCTSASAATCEAFGISDPVIED
jgi:hypothetical protein